MLLENLRRAHAAITRYMRAGSDPDLPLVLAYVDPRQASLIIGIDHLAPLPLDRYRERLRPLVEALPMRLQAMSTARHSSNPKQELADPILGGVQMVCKFTVEGPSESTITVVGSLNGTLGFIASGHGVGKTNKAIYQPSASTPNRVGTVKTISDWQQGTCDAAWVEYKNSSRTPPQPGIIFNNGNPLKVTGVKQSTSSNLGDQVVMQGSVSAGETRGRIEATQVTVLFKSGEFEQQTLTNQVLTNYKSEAGDSGAPVFEISGPDQATLLGINVGEAAVGDVSSWGPSLTPHLTHYGIYSPWESIQTELGDIDVIYS